jgi:hypothetical protein
MDCTVSESTAIPFGACFTLINTEWFQYQHRGGCVGNVIVYLKEMIFGYLDYIGSGLGQAFVLTVKNRPFAILWYGICKHASIKLISKYKRRYSSLNILIHGFSDCRSRTSAAESCDLL